MFGLPPPRHISTLPICAATGVSARFSLPKSRLIIPAFPSSVKLPPPELALDDALEPRPLEVTHRVSSP
jgi:hypothetical protein